MRKLLLLFLLFCGLTKSQAQFFKNNFYYEGEIGGITSFLVQDADGKTQIMTLGGMSFRGGIGIHNREGSVMFGLHSGIEGNFRHDTGILPLYINSRIALGVGDDSKLILAFGYGKSFQIGTENFKGSLHKYTIGFATITDGDNMQTFFIEANNHGFYYPDGVKAITLNLGYTFTFL